MELMALTCPTCGSKELLIVDGKYMTEEELLHLSSPPREIKHEMYHDLKCDSEDNRWRLRFEPDYVEKVKTNFMLKNRWK